MSTNQNNQNKFRFILLRGVLGWGVPTAILSQLIKLFTGEESFFDGILLSLIIFPIVGVFFGYYMWKLESKN
jgi:phosphate/sulfate permease